MDSLQTGFFQGAPGNRIRDVPFEGFEYGLHEAVFERMEGDGGEPSFRIQEPYGLEEGILDGTELVVDGDA